MNEQRLPFDPLERLLRAWHGTCAYDSRVDGKGKSHGLWCAQQAAVMLGVSERSVQRYRRSGLDPWMADRLATHVGLHPQLIWGDDWLDGANPAAEARS